MRTVEQYWESYLKYGFIKEQVPGKCRYILPPHLGEGGFEIWGDPTSCMVCYSDAIFYKPCTVYEGVTEKMLEFGQYFCGDVSFFQKRDTVFPMDHGLNYLVNYPYISGYKRMEPNQRLLCVGLAYREKFFNALPYELPEDFWETAAAVLNPDVISLPPITIICEQIRTCQLAGTALEMYVKGKALEAFAITLDYVYAHRKKPAVKIDSQDRKALEAVKEILRRDLISPPQIKELAASLSTNQQKLMAGFKQLNGMTIYTYLKQIRMERASELIKDSNISISEIAKKVGYHGDGHFQKAFKDVYKVTPVKWRNEIRAGK